MKITRVVAAGVLVVAAMAAAAQRRPAVVDALEQQRECALRAARLDAERFEALKRVHLLRGALAKLRRDMRTAGPRPWGGLPPEGSIYREVYDAAGEALATDDRLAAR